MLFHLHQIWKTLNILFLVPNLHIHMCSIVPNFMV